jgi:hypothetical protein
MLLRHDLDLDLRSLEWLVWTKSTGYRQKGVADNSFPQLKVRYTLLRLHEGEKPNKTYHREGETLTHTSDESLRPRMAGDQRRTPPHIYDASVSTSSSILEIEGNLNDLSCRLHARFIPEVATQISGSAPLRFDLGSTPVSRSCDGVVFAICAKGCGELLVGRCICMFTTACLMVN